MAADDRQRRKGARDGIDGERVVLAQVGRGRPDITNAGTPSPAHAS
jgi:hypothetical protein